MNMISYSAIMRRGKIMANLDLIVASKILVGKILANGSEFAKFANIFPRRIIALYSKLLS